LVFVVKPIRVEYCGEWYDVVEPNGLSIGRESELIIDDNPFLHRRFLQIYPENGLWWLGNTGNQLSATVTDVSGHVQAWLAPGARLPIVFEQLHVLFSAGNTTYDFTVHADPEFYAASSTFMDRAGAARSRRRRKPPRVSAGPSPRSTASSTTSATSSTGSESPACAEAAATWRRSGASGWSNTPCRRGS
jgi:hypothetical protein